jgi:hypothetical protein
MVSLEHPYRTLFRVSFFAIAFGFVEASVVVYLRALYYPAGFAFPLAVMENRHLVVEILRELATILMLASVGYLAGGRAWERFGYFLVAFGVWDIFYYVWLKVLIHWPMSLTDWDILFLIPLPWIGPVFAPLIIALGMVFTGVLLVLRLWRGKHFRPDVAAWLLALAGTIVLLYSFMSDTGATLYGKGPRPYASGLLVAGMVLYTLSYLRSCALLPRMPSSSHETS